MKHRFLLLGSHGVDKKGSAVEETSCLLPATLSPPPSFLPLGGKIRIVILAGVADTFFSKAVVS